MQTWGWCPRCQVRATQRRRIIIIIIKPSIFPTDLFKPSCFAASLYFAAGGNGGLRLQRRRRRPPSRAGRLQDWRHRRLWRLHIPQDRRSPSPQVVRRRLRSPLRSRPGPRRLRPLPPPIPRPLRRFVAFFYFLVRASDLWLRANFFFFFFILLFRVLRGEDEGCDWGGEAGEGRGEVRVCRGSQPVGCVDWAGVDPVAVRGFFFPCGLCGRDRPFFLHCLAS